MFHGHSSHQVCVCRIPVWDSVPGWHRRCPSLPCHTLASLQELWWCHGFLFAAIHGGGCCQGVLEQCAKQGWAWGEQRWFLAGFCPVWGWITLWNGLQALKCIIHLVYFSNLFWGATHYPLVIILLQELLRLARTWGKQHFLICFLGGFLCLLISPTPNRGTDFCQVLYLSGFESSQPWVKLYHFVIFIIIFIFLSQFHHDHVNPSFLYGLLHCWLWGEFSLLVNYHKLVPVMPVRIGGATAHPCNVSNQNDQNDFHVYEKLLIQKNH